MSILTAIALALTAVAVVGAILVAIDSVRTTRRLRRATDQMVHESQLANAAIARRDIARSRWL